MADGRTQVSVAGGTQPLWSPDGEELFFLAATGELTAVRRDPTGAWEPPITLFRGPYYRGSARSPGRTYDVAPDGQRFLMIKPAGAAARLLPTEIIVVENWFAELERLVPIE